MNREGVDFLRLVELVFFCWLSEEVAMSRPSDRVWLLTAVANELVDV